MSDEAIPIRQLIYTNVEAKDSPTRQRGFQIWQWSRDLTLEQRRLIAKRLEDYRLPPGTTVKSADEARVAQDLQRHIFCSVEKDLHVIARTVPMADKDKFGRGGKFFAHAVVVTDQQFRRIGFNPFPLIDGGFDFYSHPAEVSNRVGSENNGEIPGAFIRPAAVQSVGVEVERSCIINMLSHLSNDNALPIVFAHVPRKVLDFLRYLFSLLPRQARRLVTFDTLSHGQSLQQLRYSIVGAYDAKFLQTWSHRRYVRFDCDKAEFTPKLEFKSHKLSHKLLFDPHWSSLCDDDREMLEKTVQSLAARNWHEIERQKLSPQVLEALENNSQINAEIQSAIGEKLETEVPDLKGTKPFTKELPLYFVDSVDFLSQPVSLDKIDCGLLDILRNNPQKRPSGGLLNRLCERAKDTTFEELRWMCARWEGDWDKVEEISEILASLSKKQEWFRQWLEASLPKEYPGESNFEYLLERLENCHSLTEEALRDAHILLALYLKKVDDNHWIKAKLSVALLAGNKEFERTYERYEKEHFSKDWLFSQTVRTLTGKEENGIIAWAEDQYEQRIGLFLTPRGHRERRLFSVFFHSNDQSVAEQLFLNLWKCWKGTYLYKKTPSELKSSTEPSPPSDLQAHFERLISAAPNEKRDCKEKLRCDLQNSDREGFRYVANKLLEKVSGEWDFSFVAEDADRRPIWFVGLRMRWTQKSSNGPELFAAVAGSLASEFDATLPKQTIEGSKEIDLRLRWLLSRLAYSLETSLLKIA